MKLLSRSILVTFGLIILAFATTPARPLSTASPIEVPIVKATVYKAPEIIATNNPIAIADTYTPPPQPVQRVAPQSYGYSDTYPAYLRDAPVNSITDSHGMGNRQCVSYAAWIVESVYGYNITYWGSAGQWASVARSVGKDVSSTPTVGSIATTNGSPGHAAYVRSVGSSTVTVTEYNGRVPGGFATTTYSKSFFSNYIRF